MYDFKIYYQQESPVGEARGILTTACTVHCLSWSDPSIPVLAVGGHPHPCPGQGEVPYPCPGQVGQGVLYPDLGWAPAEVLSDGDGVTPPPPKQTHL